MLKQWKRVETILMVKQSKPKQHFFSVFIHFFRFFIERILQGLEQRQSYFNYLLFNNLLDLAKAPDSKWQVLLLRYFNPIGAHPR